MWKISLFLLMVFSLALWLPSAGYTQQSRGGAVDLQRIEELKVIQARNEDQIMSIPGVVGIGIGLTEEGKDLAFIVYVEKLTPNIKARVSDQIEGVPVRLIESGIFKAY